MNLQLFNESMLNTTTNLIGLNSGEYVTIESCKVYAYEAVKMEYVYGGCLLVAIIIIIICFKKLSDGGKNVEKIKC